MKQVKGEATIKTQKDEPIASHLTRQRAAEYVMNKFGIALSPATLDTKATLGGGPAFSKWSNRAYYLPADLDRWVQQRFSIKVNSTSELRGGN